MARLDAARRGWLGRWGSAAWFAGGLLVAAVLAVSCSPVGVSVQSREDLPIAIANSELPVTMTRQVPVTIEGETPVRMTQPVPVALSGPITIQLQLPTAKYEGVYISKELMDRVEVGATTAEWVLAVIGEPTHRATLRDGSEIWRWDYKPQNDASPIVSLLGGEKEHPTPLPVTAYVRIRDGVVVEKWRS